MRAIAQELIGKATKGDVAAIKEIADRLDGRPTRSVEVSGGLAISHEEALEFAQVIATGAIRQKMNF